MSAIAVKPSATGTATVEIAAPITNTPLTYDLPKHGGKVAAFGAPAAKTATGTAVDFINGSGDVVIPDDARRITIVPNSVSTNGGSVPIVQLGAGSFQTSGYLGSAANMTPTVATSSFTTGIPIVQATNAAGVIRGLMTITRVAGTNTWVSSSVMSFSEAATTSFGASNVTLSGPLDRIRLTTVNGTDTFDAGTVAILVE